MQARRRQALVLLEQLVEPLHLADEQLERVALRLDLVAELAQLYCRPLLLRACVALNMSARTEHEHAP